MAKRAVLVLVPQMPLQVKTRWVRDLDPDLRASVEAAYPDDCPEDGGVLLCDFGHVVIVGPTAIIGPTFATLARSVELCAIEAAGGPPAAGVLTDEHGHVTLIGYEVDPD